MIFCEPFAGSAAITYALLGAKPPISYMGGKTGYVAPILDAIGLSRHRPPAGIVLGEVGPMAAVHACLGGATGISAEEVGAFCLTAEVSFRVGDQSSGFNSGAAYPRPPTATEHGQVTPRGPATVGPRVEALPHPRAAEVAAIIRGWAGEEPRPLWERLRREGWPSLMPVEGGRWLGPVPVEEVAAMVLAIRWSFSEKGPEHGYGGPGCPGGAWGQEARDKALSAERFASLHATLPTFPPLAVWQGSADTLALPADLRGWIIYADPPYQGTTKYPSGDCDRATVLRLAQEWSDRGAVVAVSEAVPLPLEGWHHVEIGHARKGQKRTFGHTDEWLTMNRPAVHRPHRGQVALFGSGR